MKEISISELRLIELNILKYIDSVCEKNHIIYTLAYGTLLGAIRHKGFIPWDDDIDICMDRNNFERFVRACQTDKQNRYKLLWLDTCETYTLPLPKVIDTTTILTQNTQNEKMPLGVYVDVFILDKIPNNENQRKRYIEKLELYQRFWGYSQNKYVWRNYTLKSILRYLVYCIFHLFNPRRFAELLNNTAKEFYLSDDYSHIGSMVICTTGRNKQLLPKELFDHCFKIDFEGEQFPITCLFDYFLKMCFGNYMELPPIEKRVSNHDFYAYYKSDFT
jgi:lipopolysaccharide cholinephosphotransferase